MAEAAVVAAVAVEVVLGAEVKVEGVTTGGTLDEVAVGEEGEEGEEVSAASDEVGVTVVVTDWLAEEFTF